MHRRLVAAAAVLACALLPGASAAHDLDHSQPWAPLPGAENPAFQAGGKDATWKLLSTIPTGNPQTDVDFFRHDGDFYAAVGTLAIGPNGGGQTIMRLTEGDQVKPEVVSNVPTASCLSNPAAALGLQHDVEATPKGGTLLDQRFGRHAGGEAQILVDATDHRGRCHDQGTLGLQNAPRGGLEIIDIQDPAEPQTIGLTSHIGEAHTVNVDPKRPHIAYAVSSDGVSVNAQGVRANDDARSESYALDGFEVVDLSSCMNFPSGTTLQEKRDACRPQVYRYRWPSVAMAAGHADRSAVAGCHELEVYPDDRLTCAAIHASLVFDMSEAFDDRGTPRDFSDDRPRGEPLPCRARNSTSAGPFATKAQVTDCVVGGTGAQTVDLRVGPWRAAGAPSLEGVRHVGTAFHQGRSAGDHDALQDVEVSHEAELTGSGRHLLVTDERGGGVVPPGATCAPGVDNKQGNGGLHAYRVEGLRSSSPDDADAGARAEQAWASYARTPGGEKAVFRAAVKSGAEPVVCTSHVFQQIPGQNRIFMGWYSQGTQVVDFVEHRDGSFEWRPAGWFIPAHANQWVSHVFKHRGNADGTYTYWGVAADFNLGSRGRNSIEVYEVTLPAPPRSRGRS